MKHPLQGIFIPAATAFDRDGQIDIARMEQNCLAWQETDIAGLMVLGTNGECKLLADAESLDVVQAAVRTKKAGKTLIVGAGRESLHSTLAFIRSLSPYTDRIDYVSIMTPHFFAKLMTDEALLRYYEAVADESPFPVLLYMAPAYANGVTLPVDVVEALSHHPNIAGIKDTSADSMEALMVRLSGREDFDVLAGSINNLMINLRMGGRGGVVSAANYFPQESAEVVHLFLSGRQEEARGAHEALQALVQETGGIRGIASLKACMSLVGYDAGSPRLPVLPLEREETDRIRTALQRAGNMIE